MDHFQCGHLKQSSYFIMLSHCNSYVFFSLERQPYATVVLQSSRTIGHVSQETNKCIFKLHFLVIYGGSNFSCGCSSLQKNLPKRLNYGFMSRVSFVQSEHQLGTTSNNKYLRVQHVEAQSWLPEVLPLAPIRNSHQCPTPFVFNMFIRKNLPRVSLIFSPFLSLRKHCRQALVPL